MKISKELIDLFLEQKKYLNHEMIFLILISEASTLFIVALIGIGSAEVSVNTTDFRHVILFILSIMIYYISNKAYLNRIVSITENITNDLRKKLTIKVKNCNLYAYEHLGESLILSRITKETAFIGQWLPHLIEFVQAVILVIFCLTYMIYISPLSFLVFTSLSAAGYFIYDFYNKISYQHWNTALKKEVLLFDALRNIMHGFKEIKLNCKKREEIYDIFSNVSEEVFENKLKSWHIYNTNNTFYYSLIYITVGIIIFALPTIAPLETEDSIKLLALIVFMLTPFWEISSTIPVIGQIETTLELLLELEKKMDDGYEKASVWDSEKTNIIPDFQEIRLENIFFQYYENDQPSFKSGPFNLTINKGEIICITGGNGSGKSTLLKLITSLYYPELGNIFVDNRKITEPLIQPYRELFGSVFSDYHLFDKLYGIKKVDKERLNALLKLMKLDDKTQYINGAFTNIHLSTGQKKRLALISALMENKPIYILDEWAADQDPTFHEYYYQTLLPNLKKEGKTLIIVSHDDRYYSVADKLIKMEYGKIINRP